MNDCDGTMPTEAEKFAVLVVPVMDTLFRTLMIAASDAMAQSRDITMAIVFIWLVCMW